MADYFIAFSATRREFSAGLYAKDPHIVLPFIAAPITSHQTISEIANAHIIIELDEFKDASYALHSVTVVKYRTEAIFLLNSGVPSLGIYVHSNLDFLTQTVITKQEIELNNFFASQDIQRVPEMQLAFGYCQDPRTLEAYLQFIEKWSTENPNKQILLVTKDLEGMREKSISPKIIWVKENNIPFSLSEAIIARSTLPLLVTGDVSLSLALDNHKPFIYESQKWKRAFFSSLAKKFPIFNGLSFEMEKGGRIARDEVAEVSNRAKRYYEIVFKNPSFFHDFEKQVRELKARYSIPQRLDELFQEIGDPTQFLKLTDKQIAAKMKQINMTGPSFLEVLNECFWNLVPTI